MTREILRSMILAGESTAVEFKGESQRPLNDRGLVETVVCLANRGGAEPGYLLVGVEDDGRVTGARPRHEAGITDPLRIQALVANRTRPSLSCRVELIDLEEGPVLVIEVPVARAPVGTTEGMYLRRAIGGRGQPECLPFHFHEMQAYQADRGILDYSALEVMEAKWGDLDPLEFERYRRVIRESRGLGDQSLVELSDLELAKALGAVTANHEVKAVRVLGLLLFGKTEAIRKFLPLHEVAFQKLSELQVRVNEFLRYPLLRVMDELLGRFRASYQEQEVMVGMVRVGVPDYPERACREAVANAIIHRDFTRPGAVYVQWYEDRIEISNAGGLPEGVRLDNLLVTPPRPRNPLLADAFKRAGLVERTARGIDTIFFEQLRNGRPAPSYDRSTESDVVMVLPGGRANLDFVRLVAEESQHGRPLGLDALILLNRLWLEEDHLDTVQAARMIQKSEAEARSVLTRLTESGLVEPREERKSRTYNLSAATSRRLGKDAMPVLKQGDETRQLEQKALQYAAIHGKITRKETSELCRIGDLQARNLLARLVKRGELARQGSKRGTFYTLMSKDMDLSKS